MSKPLAGVKVIEIGQEIQGPFGALILADLGADVIKIEKRGAGDPSRWALAGRAGGEGTAKADVPPYFLAVNRGKRRITPPPKPPEAATPSRARGGWPVPR